MRAERRKKKTVIIIAAVICAAAVLIAVFGSSMGSARMFGLGKKVVGKGIKPAEITDFYYTVDDWHIPPHYQRYRFYLEGGKPMFFHETRDGEGTKDLPLTEKNTTRTGVTEITDEDWQTFLSLVDKGAVTSRDALEPTSGGSGPWTYIYWNKDKGKMQVFSFETDDKLDRFVAFSEEIIARN